MSTKTRTANPDMQELEKSAADLAESIGIRGVAKLIAIQGGRNNRVFRLKIGNECYLLKSYFRHKNDPRDRLGAEYAFVSFAWENGIRCIPRPIICDSEKKMALYEFIEGTRLTSLHITENEIFQALAFYRDINRFRFLDSAASLPTASEACFSIGEHLENVERRLIALKSIDKSSEANRRALNFVQNELIVIWNKTVGYVRKTADQLGLQIDSAIENDDRCLSPSDFGFHNAIVVSGDQLRFIDFEYAGWDDPAKTVCDFFCQPEVLVPMKYYDIFVENVIPEFSKPEVIKQRITMLLPVYRIKWCCILLNEYLPVGESRRGFAHYPVNTEQNKARQLKKAKLMLQDLFN